MPELLSAALFERSGRALVAHRKPARPPLGGQWVLPLTRVGSEQTAEEALRRHAREQFGIDVAGEEFIDTVYVEDPADAERYIANIFRTPLGEGPMRFNTEGDYDDARWLGSGDLDQVLMPPAMREPLVSILRGETVAPAIDWTKTDEQGVPLGERAWREEAPPPPDNAESWNAISKAYQTERFGELYGDRFMWTWVSSEDDLHMLDDVRNKRVLVLGCGGGQDCVALAKMGAIAVGIDPSGEQIAHAKQYADRHGVENASFAVTAAEDLSRFDDESFDVVVSSHALNYVLETERALAEAHRVLRGGGALIFAVSHPLNAVVSDDAPFMLEGSYWDDIVDWSWEFEDGSTARFRQRFPTFGEWFEMLSGAGFEVERVIEPREDERTPPPGSKTKFDAARARMLPHTVMFKSRKR
ncbi:MAG TPA: methyltransferase domain-containing protein [Dehalococcoidia bacterium]|nr:methyltransferase domain-containing protein [Dehalococcoidia bacterium]